MASNFSQVKKKHSYSLPKIERHYKKTRYIPTDVPTDNKVVGHI